MNKKIILVDMDDVLADFEAKFLEDWKKKFLNHPHIPLNNRKAFRIEEDYPSELKKEVEGIFSAPGFFENLDKIPGGKEALIKMQEIGHNVFICTSPISKYANCVLEKYRWVEKNLGYEWTKKIIMTKDKTLVFGDILIDDKPEHTGLKKPAWKHVLFEKSYNQHISTKPRITWNNWEKILE